MKTFMGYGDQTNTLIAEGTVVGYYYPKRPVYEIQAESLEEAQNAPLDKWSYTGDECGGWYEWDDEACDEILKECGFDPREEGKDDEDITLYEIYDIEEDI